MITRAIVLPLSLVALIVVALRGNPIDLVPLGPSYFAQYFDQASTPEAKVASNASEQRDTFVPEPNHPPLFTRASGTR